MLGLEHHIGVPGLHHDLAVRLLFVAHLDHVHLAIQIEDGTRKAERAAPLAGARLGGEPFDTLLGVVVRLRHGGIGFVATRGAHPLVFEIDLRGCAERAFESFRPE